MRALRDGTYHGDGCVTVMVTGDLDLATKMQLRSHLAAVVSERGGQQIVLDLRGLSFIDAGGLGTLIAIQNLAQRAGRTLVLACPPPCLLRLLAITGLENHFTFTPAAGV